MTDETNTTPKDIWDYAKLPMDASVRLSYERTMLSHERTLMAWIRTATSLITFGFTVYKFFAFERGGSPRPPHHQLFGPREYAMLMIGIGLIGLVLAALQNRQHRTRMRESGLKAPLSYTTFVAILIGVLGLLSLVSVIFGW